MKMQQIQSQILTHQQIQSLQVLQLGTYELFDYIRDLALENPLIDPNEIPPGRENLRETCLPKRINWSEENDWQNRSYHQYAEQEFDPLLLAADDGGLAETLPRVLFRQLENCVVSRETYLATAYLIGCLDENGYLRTLPGELVSDSSFSEESIRKGAALLRSFEPAGVGASDLSDCLVLQLERVGDNGPALEIAAHHLEALARGNLRSIAGALHITVEEVEAAAAVIRDLNPKPGAAFASVNRTHYVSPDVIVEENDGLLCAHLVYGERKWFTINASYVEMLHTAEDEEVRHYLSEKLHEAKDLQRSIEQRRSTLVRCVDEILRYQECFFREGERKIVPLRLQDVAEHLSLHPSTVSRALSGKYLQCAFGLFPLNYFFPTGASQGGDYSISSVSAKAMLKEIIRDEDTTRPLSDRKIAEIMAEHGCEISRRTVAKYRNELGIPGTALRARSKS